MYKVCVYRVIFLQHMFVYIITILYCICVWKGFLCTAYVFINGFLCTALCRSIKIVSSYTKVVYTRFTLDNITVYKVSFVQHIHVFIYMYVQSIICTIYIFYNMYSLFYSIFVYKEETGLWSSASRQEDICGSSGCF